MTSLDTLLPVVGDTATVTLVRPGDTLAVQLGHHDLSESELDDLRGHLLEALPEGVKVVFFDQDVKFGILRADTA